MDEIVSFFPEPTAHGAIPTADGGEVHVTTEGATAGLVFKTIFDPYVGRLNFVKVLSGTLTARHRTRQRAHRQEGARRARAQDGRQGDLRRRRGARRRHRRPPEARRRHHRRHAVRRRATSSSPRFRCRSRSIPSPSSRRPRPTRTSSAPRSTSSSRRSPRCCSSATTRRTRRCSPRWATPAIDVAHRQAQGPLQRRGRDRRAAHPLPRDDPQDGAAHRAATRSRPAAPASSPTAGCASSPTPAAATSSSTRSSAARSPRQFILAIDKGVQNTHDRGRARRLPDGRREGRRLRRLATTRSTRTRWRSARPRASASAPRPRRPTWSCSSRSRRSTSTSPTSTPARSWAT